MIIQWSSVRFFGESRIITSNYVWLFVIPLLAKNIEKLTTYLGIDLVLTFTVSRLFYASLCFVIGTIVYQLRCPKLIKDHKGYADFEQKGKTVQHVVEYLQSAQDQPFSKLNFNEVKSYVENFDICEKKEDKTLINLITSTSNVQCSYIDRNLSKDFFWKTYNKLNSSNYIASKVSVFSYLVGCVFLFIVAAENIIYALKYFWL